MGQRSNYITLCYGYAAKKDDSYTRGMQQRRMHESSVVKGEEYAEGTEHKNANLPTRTRQFKKATTTTHFLETVCKLLLCY